MAFNMIDGMFKIHTFSPPKCAIDFIETTYPPKDNYISNTQYHLDRQEIDPWAAAAAVSQQQDIYLW